MKFIRLIFCISTFCLGSCKHTWKDAIKNVDPKIIYNNSPDGWNEIQVFQVGQGNSLVTVQKIHRDTTKYLFLTLHDDGRMLTNRYSRKFPCDGDTCMLEVNEIDTLYFYKHSGGEKTFISGEYQYRYEYDLLKTRKEREYFEEHEDSLRRVRGNNLSRFVH